MIGITTIPASMVHATQWWLDDDWVAGLLNPAPVEVCLGPDGDYYVTNGHHRLAAHLQQGTTDIPVVIGTCPPEAGFIRTWR